MADLQFPVVVLYSTALTILYKDAVDLSVMSVQLVINSRTPPVLIDSKLDVFTLQKLRSTHNGLWLIAHPAGATEVTFELKPAPTSGLDAARSATRAQLNLQTWRTDLEQRRKNLAVQTSLPAMLELLRSDAD